MGKNEPIVERRRCPRAEFTTTAYVFSEGIQCGVYDVKNLSAGGALLEGSPNLVPGTKVRVLLKLPKRHLQRLEGRVVRSQRAGNGSVIAVAFQITDPRIEDAIHDAVLARLEETGGSRTSSVHQADECTGIRRSSARNHEALDYEIGSDTNKKERAL